MLRTPALGHFRMERESFHLPEVVEEVDAWRESAWNDEELRLAANAEELPGKRKVLIVQGDWEGGMSLLAGDLKDAGHKVGKVVFCAPDYFYKFHGIRTHVFRKPLEEFDKWLRELIRSEGYDTFFLYDHHRPYNRVAWDMADEFNLRCYVFEPGLIGSNCVTVFDRKSPPIPTMAKAWAALMNGAQPPGQEATSTELREASTLVKLLAFGSNFFLSRVTSPLFPNFVDQREMKLWHHFKHSVIHLWRFFAHVRDCELEPLFAGEWSGTYYVAPLQVHSDTKVTMESDFNSIEQFIKRVVKSFARNAPADTKLVFKVHPMDRGHKDYVDLINGLDDRLGGNRLLNVDRVHLPTLLENSRGLVNINSSVGLAGLIHNIPVMALGKAVYDLPGLTFSGGLDAFWTEAQRPEPALVKHFVNLLLATSQGRGTLSQRCSNVPGRCKIQWPGPFMNDFFARDSE